MRDAARASRLLGLIEDNRTAIREVARRNGAVEIRLIGSVARGTDSADSDVDFLVAFEEGRSLFDLGNLSLELEELLGVDVDVISQGGLNDRDVRTFLEGAATV